MIDPLAWDTEFFGRRIGVLAGDPPSHAAVQGALDAAAAAGFEYLISRPSATDFRAVRALEEAGFYLTDLGAVWSTNVAGYLDRGGLAPATPARLATEADVPLLAHHAPLLFRGSRFYDDPFFSREEADRLHVAWVTNSVLGKAADSVWVVPDTGFVTCKIAGDGAGEIVLIGVWEGRRRSGGGRALMSAAMRWFHTRNVRTVRVKTQLKNMTAMNFYHRLGFDLHRADITMGCIVSRRPARAEVL